MLRRGTASRDAVARASVVGAAVLLLGMGCVGQIGDDGDGFKEGTVGGPTPTTLSEIGPGGLRRLTAVEYRASVLDLTGIDAVMSSQFLPEDPRSPYDNNYALQTASEALIDGLEILAGDVAGEVLADPALRAKIVPCEPSGPADAACFREFLSTFGRRALRRPLAAAELDTFATLFDHATQSGDFWIGVDSALRAFLQHPEFLYLVEIGKPVEGQPGVYRLTDYQLGARLSYFLWGTTPPDWLLDDEEAGKLATAEGVRAAATKLTGDERARERIARFHAMWLSYENMAHDPDLTAAMRLETDTLLAKVVFEEKTPWTDVLRAQETFLTPELAAHYGLPAPAGGKAGWVPYGDSGRVGLLSQGSFLSAVPKFNDTSPTQRGLLIRARLFCQPISLPPPELKVNTDMPPMAPDPNACKSERYFMSKKDGCKMCHSLMDPIGFGLENYDSEGRYRATELDRPDCPIDGKGVLAGVGEFQGPAGLADLLIQSGGIEACVARQLYRFAVGRFDLDEHDDALLERLVEASSTSSGLRLDQVMMELVTSDAFRFRRQEVAP